MKNGGPAFPRPSGHNGLPSHEEHESNVAQSGMSLRDYFASQALGAILSSYQSAATLEVEHRDKAARAAYTYADAMLKARGE